MNIARLGIIIGGIALALGGTIIVIKRSQSKVSLTVPADIPLLSSYDTSLPDTSDITPTESPVSATPTATATTSETATASPSASTASSPRAPKPFPTSSPSSGTATPTPSTKVLATVTRSATACTSLWVVPSTEAADYIAGAEYFGVQLESGATTAEIPNNPSANALAYVVDDTGYTCLISYQSASTTSGATMTFNASSTIDSVAYPELSGTTTYELSERIRRLHLLSSYADLEAYITTGITTRTLQALAEQATYLAKIKAVTAAYDTSYPSQF